MGKKKIICVMGKSGSGKSTLINEIYENGSIFYPVSSFTTRLPRNKEDLKTHVFVDDNFYENHKDQAIAVYHSNHGYHSWVDDTAFDNRKVNLYAIDPLEFTKFYKKYNHIYDICGIYLFVDEETRKERLKQRGQENYYSEEEHLSYDILSNSSLEKEKEYFKLDISNKDIIESKSEMMEIIAKFLSK